MIENNSKQLSITEKYVKLIIHTIEQPEKYFFMAKNTEIYSVENTINKLHIHSDLNFIYK